jgi:hypothetical protein
MVTADLPPAMDGTVLKVSLDGEQLQRLFEIASSPRGKELIIMMRDQATVALSQMVRRFGDAANEVLGFAQELTRFGLAENKAVFSFPKPGEIGYSLTPPGQKFSQGLKRG